MIQKWSNNGHQMVPKLTNDISEMTSIRHQMRSAWVDLWFIARLLPSMVHVVPQVAIKRELVAPLEGRVPLQTIAATTRSKALQYPAWGLVHGFAWLCGCGCLHALFYCCLHVSRQHMLTMHYGVVAGMWSRSTARWLDCRTELSGSGRSAGRRKRSWRKASKRWSSGIAKT